MSEKEQLLDFVMHLTQEEVEAIVANFDQIAASAAAMAAAPLQVSKY